MNGDRFFLVNSYFVNSERVTAANKVSYLYVLLMNSDDTFLCRFHKSIVQKKDSQLPTVQDFLHQVPIPFEDTVSAEPNLLFPDKLNRIMTLRSVRQETTVNANMFCSSIEEHDSSIIYKRRNKKQCCDESRDPFVEFVNRWVDFNQKEATKCFIKTKYLKSIQCPNKSIFVPKNPSCSFIRYDKNNLIRVLLEESSDFISATNQPELEMAKRKICFVPRFTFAALFKQIATKPCQEGSRSLIISDGTRSIVLSKEDEILNIHESLDSLELSMKDCNCELFQTNHPAIRKRLSVQRNICIPKERFLLPRRILRSLKKQLFEFQKQCYMKKGVYHLTKKRPSNQLINVYDFSNFYAQTIVNYSTDAGIRRLFLLLIKLRERFKNTKLLLTTAFGMCKRYQPHEFFRTLNLTVYIMLKTYMKNKKNVFGMCKDSFFTISDKIRVPVSGLILKLDYRLQHLRMKDINTYAGIDTLTDTVIIKGIHFPPFQAVKKIVFSLFRYLVENTLLDTIDLPAFIKKHVELNESDFYVEVTKPLKPDDFVHFGTNEGCQMMYSQEDIENQIYTTSQPPSVHVRPKRVLGAIDVNAYVKHIITTVICFVRTFGFLQIIDENVIFDTDLFLQKYIQCVIFQRTKHCCLPEIKLHHCQLIT